MTAMIKVNIHLYISPLLILTTLWLNELAVAQTRIEPPTIIAAGTGKDNRSDGSQSFLLDAEIPIPIALWFAMPYIHWYEHDLKTSLVQNADTFSQDRRVAVGLLHHPAEGAPEWKWEIGRFGTFDTHGHLISRFTINLDKPLPNLRPSHSDKLDSWLGISAIFDHHQHMIFLPELGWVWFAPHGLVIDVAVPDRARIGWQDETWLTSFGWRQRWIIEDRALAEGHTSLVIVPKRFLTLEASRRVGLGVSMNFAAGILLPRAPHVEVGIKWEPK